LSCRSIDLTRNPPAPHLYTLSLHDALPICAVEIESQWTARKREQAGDFLTVRTRSCEEKLPPKRSLDGAPSRSCQAPQNLESARSEEHTSELPSRENLVCRLLLEKKKTTWK